MAHRLVALLRGINVGPSKRVEMARLRALVSGLGYTEVSTLLNSGNVVFTSTRAAVQDAASRIEKALVQKLAVSCRVTVVSASDIDSSIAENPLLGMADNPSRLMVAFLKNPGDLARLAPFLKEDWGADALAVGTRAAYLWCAKGVLESRLATEVQRALGDGITMRNWATMLKVQALAKK
jgi:uncharacterized protein (DUF1697 family)